MAGRFAPPNLGPYQYHEVLSSLRKTIKLADKREAIYWANVILEKAPGNATKMLAKQLWIMAAEDIDDPLIVLRAFAVYQMASVVKESDHLYFLTAVMCDAMQRSDGERASTQEMCVQLVTAMAEARKWWEHTDGVEVDQLWSLAIGDLKVKERNHPIPEVALDQHTARGNRLARAGKFGEPGQARDELSGTDRGRLKTLHQFLSIGRLDKDYRVPDTTPGYQELRNAQCDAQGEPREFQRSVPPKDEEFEVEPEPALFDVGPVGGGRVPERQGLQYAGNPAQFCEF